MPTGRARLVGWLAGWLGAATPSAAAPLRVRFGAMAATLAVHALAMLIALAAGHQAPEKPQRLGERLTVVTPQSFRPPPLLPAKTRTPTPHRPVPVNGNASPAQAALVSAGGPVPAAAPPATTEPAAEPATPAPRAEPSIQPAPAKPPETGLAAYRQLLWSHIAARRPRGLSLSGTVEVRFRIDGGGRLVSAAIAAPSGNAMLDRIALRTIRTASPFPAPPATMGEDQLAFTIEFRLH